MTNKPKISTTVRAQVTVDIYVGTWGGNSDFLGLHQVAKREAAQTIQNRLNDCGLKIVGEPKMMFVTHEEKDR